MFGHKLPKSDLDSVKHIYGEVEGRDKRDELNLYATGYEDDLEDAPSGGGGSGGGSGDDAPIKPSTPSADPEAPVSPPSGPDKSPTFPGPGEASETEPSESENS
jgi:hypothetical protein